MDSRFATTGWRTIQNYVGRSLAPGLEEIHLIPPKPSDLPSLMSAWLAMSDRLATTDTVPPIAAAARIAMCEVVDLPEPAANLFIRLCGKTTATFR